MFAMMARSPGRRAARGRRCARLGAIVLAGLAAADPARGGQTGSPAGISPVTAIDRSAALEGPPAPVAPDVISRDASGRATIRPVPLPAPMRLDGRLDEAVYSTVPAITNFIQVEPQGGAQATEQTEVWLLYDREAIYVSVRCWDSDPPRMVANEMRRDSNNIYSNEYLGIVLDTFHDRRNAFYFAVNPIGGRSDGQITNERQFNTDLNPIWEVEVARDDKGWTVEAAIPFASLRYGPGKDQVWGFNVERSHKWKNEISFITPIPPAFGWSRAFMQVSYAATLVGLEAPPGSNNLEIKPYAVSDLTSDRNATPPVSNKVGGDIGVDLKYGITQNLTADFTYNTDFAQVEADEQQVNLTRFSLFFPEKREFFLENQGTFGFGGAGSSGAGVRSSDTPVLFYSRRIGLEAGRVVPIEGGGRLTGRVGRFSVALLNIQSDDVPAAGVHAANFGVVRVKRDLFRRSSVGVLYTGRSVAAGGLGRNDVYGVDGTFTFYDNLGINTYWARTRTTGQEGRDTSYRAHLDYAGDRYGAQVEHLFVGDDFNPEIGFVRRSDMRRSFAQLRFSPRPRASKTVRKFFWIGSGAYVENGAGRLETRDVSGEFSIEFQNSDRLQVTYNRTYEFLPEPFRIARGVTLPVGGYEFDNVRAAFTFGQQRPVSGNLSVERGSFYSGDKTTFGVGRGRVNFTPQLSIEPSLSINWVELVEGSFTTTLIGSRVTYTMTPKMFVSALMQFNSGASIVASNVRLRWEYRAGSELFLVYNDERDTLGRRFPALANRALILKINRLLRF